LKIAFLYEHPNWSESLIAAFKQRGIQLTLVNVADLAFDTAQTNCRFDFAINRVNIMPSAERNPRVALQTQHYLNWLELGGTRIINGARAHTIGASKALQNGIFSSLNLNHPKGIAVYGGSDIAAAAREIGFPLMIKPNIGGSGAGIQRYESEQELAVALENKAIDLGVDGTGLVQSFIQSDGYVYRVEVLGDALFYSIRQSIQEGIFNYCAADGCSTEGELDFCVADGGTGIAVFTPPDSVLENVIKIIDHCGADVGGVEYFLEQSTGNPCYYDINPYSNFVAEGEALLGFSPEQKYIDFVMSRIQGSDKQKY